MKMFVYPTPENAKCVLSHDSGWTVEAVPDTHPTGRVGQSFTIPANTPDYWGSHLTITADKMVPISLRGILTFGQQNLAYLLCDDFHLQAEIVCPEVPPVEPPIPPNPTPAQNPLDLINQVYANRPLLTKEQCGKFTEDCCTALHETFSDKYGHLKKSGAQNQYNGHAVDAINLLKDHTNPDGSITKSGVYDIILSSESPDAKPAFNRAGDAVDVLWYYPA